MTVPRKPDGTVDVEALAVQSAASKAHTRALFPIAGIAGIAGWMAGGPLGAVLGIGIVAAVDKMRIRI
jgi:hypothetical protein